MRARDEAALVAELQAMIPTHSGPRPWWTRLTLEQQDTTNVCQRAWETGALGAYRRRAAKAIAVKLQSVGVNIGVQGVETWLKQLPTAS